MPTKLQSFSTVICLSKYLKKKLRFFYFLDFLEADDEQSTFWLLVDNHITVTTKLFLRGGNDATLTSVGVDITKAPR